MKNKLCLIIAFILAILSFQLASCEEDVSDDSDNASHTTETQALMSDIVIAEDNNAIYSLIRYIDACEEEVALVSAFKNQLNAQTNLKFGIYADWTIPALAPPADAPEIIIGLTEREQTQSIIAEHNPGRGDCIIQVFDNKIVIVAPDYKDLSVGFDYFLGNIKTETDTESGKQTVLYTGGNYVYSSKAEHICDKASDLSSYRIVYDKSGKNKDIAEDLAKAFKKNLEVDLEVVSESEQRSEREIVIGKMSDLSRFDFDYSKLSGLSYVIASSNKDILIYGATDYALETAVKTFISRFVRSGNIVAMNLKVNDSFVFNTFSGGYSEKLAEGADTRIMSFNILSEEWDSAAVMDGRDVRVSSVIMNYQPDVVALQEVSNKWYPVLDDYIGDIYKFTRKRTPSGSGTYTTLIYNTETTKLIEEGIKVYSRGNSERLRSIVWGVFESIASKERYIVCSTHWDASSDASNVRILQATEMAEFAKEMQGKYHLDVFIGGDYNAKESTTEYKTYIDKSGFVDAKNSAQTINKACNTYHTLFKELDTSSYESIDHITFDSSTASKVLFYNTLYQEYVIDASDHCPIYIDIKLSK